MSKEEFNVVLRAFIFDVDHKNKVIEISRPEIFAYDSESRVVYQEDFKDDFSMNDTFFLHVNSASTLINTPHLKATKSLSFVFENVTSEDDFYSIAYDVLDNDFILDDNTKILHTVEM